MIVSRFKYCINGETGFTSIKHDEQIKPVHVENLAKEKVKRKYLKLFGTATLTDLRIVKKVNTNETNNIRSNYSSAN